jgi:hypothetical protein
VGALAYSTSRDADESGTVKLAGQGLLVVDVSAPMSACRKGDPEEVDGVVDAISMTAMPLEHRIEIGVPTYVRRCRVPGVGCCESDNAPRTAGRPGIAKEATARLDVEMLDDIVTIDERN